MKIHGKMAKNTSRTRKNLLLGVNSLCHDSNALKASLNLQPRKIAQGTGSMIQRPSTLESYMRCAGRHLASVSGQYRRVAIMAYSTWIQHKMAVIQDANKSEPPARQMDNRCHLTTTVLRGNRARDILLNPMPRMSNV